MLQLPREAWMELLQQIFSALLSKIHQKEVFPLILRKIANQNIYKLELIKKKVLSNLNKVTEQTVFHKRLGHSLKCSPCLRIENAKSPGSGNLTQVSHLGNRNQLLELSMPAWVCINRKLEPGLKPRILVFLPARPNTCPIS